MIRKTGLSLKKMRQIQLLLTGVVLSILFLGVGFANAGVPKDELPVPLGSIQSIGNCCGYAPLYWNVNKTLSSVSTAGGSICYNSDVGGSWASPDGNVNANAHIILYYKGTWLASPWDYMGIGQQCKNNDHIGDIPYMGWKPRLGETYYFYLSGISRDPSGGSQARTNIVKAVWGQTGYPPPACQGVAPPVFNSLTAATHFTDGFVSDSVSVIAGGKGGLKQTPTGYTYNVQFSWDISNSDGVELKFSDGADYKTAPDDPKVDGTPYLINRTLGETVTFTVYAENECTDENGRPSKTIEIKAVSAPVAPARSLLLSPPQ